MSGLEGLGCHDEIREIKLDFENSEDEKRRFKIGNLKQKAISASNKFTHSLKKRGKRKVDHKVPPISIEDVRDAKEECAVYELRLKLLHRDLLPPRHDDYHTLLRFLKARDFHIEKTIQMWEEMINWRKEFGTDTILEGIKNFTRTAANLLAAMTKIDNSYYPETLHRMYIVNAGPGFKKMLWPAAQKFLDAKTIAKIQVLEPKSLPKLLEVIDSSQLPDFLGGSCTCYAEGGCLRSNKGPWNNPDIMKKVDTYTKIRPLKGRCSDTSTAESGSDVDDPCSQVVRKSSTLPDLAPVPEEVKAADPIAYYSCDDNFSLAEKAMRSHEGEGHSENRPHKADEMDNALDVGTSSLEGTGVNHWFKSVKEKVENGDFLCVARALISFVVGLVAFFRSLRFELWRRQNNVYPSNLMDNDINRHSPAVETANEEDRVVTCIQRLQRLEKVYEELSSKPAGIPLEKEQMLMDSFDRIKSVEADLEQTKKALHVAAVKQLEIAELLEKLQESKCHRRKLFC